MKTIRITGIILRCLGFLLFLDVFRGLILQGLTGYQITSLDTLNLIPNGPLKLLIAQGLAVILALIALPLIYIYFLKPGLKTILKGMSTVNSMYVLLFSVAILIAATPLVAALSEWNQNIWLPEGIARFAKTMEDAARQATELMVYQSTPGGFLLACLVVGILPAISEELVFRGLMQGELKEEKWNMHVIIWFTAILFSAVHLQFYGFIPRTLLGAGMGYLAWWTNSLSAPMIFHAVNNTITLIAYNLYKFKNIGPAPEENPFSWYTILSSALITGVLFYVFRRRFHQPEKTEAAI